MYARVYRVNGKRRPHIPLFVELGFGELREARQRQEGTRRGSVAAQNAMFNVISGENKATNHVGGGFKELEAANYVTRRAVDDCCVYNKGVVNVDEKSYALVAVKCSQVNTLQLTRGDAVLVEVWVFGQGLGEWERTSRLAEKVGWWFRNARGVAVVGWGSPLGEKKTKHMQRKESMRDGSTRKEAEGREGVQ